MVSRSIVSRFVTRHREDLLSRVAPEQTEGDPAGTEHDPGASRRALLRQLGALGLAAVGGTALGAEAVGAKGQHASKRSKRQKAQKQKGRRDSAAPEETEVAEVTPASAEGQDGQVSAEALIPSPGPTSGARQWRINTANGAALRPGVAFSLFNTRNSSYVRYGSRWFGINLVWSSTASRTFTVRRSSGTITSIKYGDLVALRNTTGGYIKYGARDWGINLNWNSTPVYQWRVQGGTTGTIVPNNATVTLYNTVSPRPKFPPWCGKPGAAVVYGWRPVGINLVWNPPGFWVPSLSIPGVPDWAESWLKNIAAKAATYYGIPVEQYKATVKTLCLIGSLDEDGETSEAYAEDAGYANIDEATLSAAAEDKRAAGDAVTDENPDDLGSGNEATPPTEESSANGNHRDREKREHGKHRDARKQGNGNHRGANKHRNGKDRRR